MRRNRIFERHFLDAALQRDPKNLPALEQLLALDIQELRQSDAERHAQEILQIQPRHAQANYILGSINSAKENYPMAEAFLRVSLSSRTN